MSEPPCDTTEGVMWIVGVALMAMLLGYMVGVTSQARETPHAHAGK